MGKRRIMRAFKISEISGVDKPAQTHARAAIMKRADDDVEGEAGFDTSIDTTAARTKLRLAYEDERRSHGNLSDTYNMGLAWRSLSDEERNALLEADDTGEDPTFDPANVDVAKLADFLLQVRAELIGKAQPQLTREQRFAAACDEKPWLLKIARDARRAKLAAGNLPDTVIAKRKSAFNAIHARAVELMKADHTLTIERARIEARARWPELAKLERA